MFPTTSSHDDASLRGQPLSHREALRIRGQVYEAAWIFVGMSALVYYSGVDLARKITDRSTNDQTEGR
jgi:hypothetical protein